jgi:hypothetical protein
VRAAQYLSFERWTAALPVGGKIDLHSWWGEQTLKILMFSAPDGAERLPYACRRSIVEIELVHETLPAYSEIVRTAS